MGNIASELPSRRAIWVSVCPAPQVQQAGLAGRELRNRVAAALGVEVGLVKVRAQQREHRPVTLGEVRPGPAAKGQPHMPHLP
jgi:hypothetical protein